MPEGSAPDSKSFFAGIQGVSLDLPVRVTVADRTREGRIVALGPAGAAIALDDPPAPGDAIQITFALESYPYEITGRVQVLFKGVYGKPGMGVSLGGIPEFERSVIADYMQRLVQGLMDSLGMKSGE